MTAADIKIQVIHYYLVFLPFATYKRVGEAVVLTVFGMVVYRRVGTVRNICGINLKARANHVT